MEGKLNELSKRVHFIFALPSRNYYLIC